MANDMRYLSAEEEAKLLKPIDEYVGKIQAQIDALRVEAVQLKRKLRMQNMKRFAQISKQSTSAQFPA